MTVNSSIIPKYVVVIGILTILVACDEGQEPQSGTSTSPPPAAMVTQPSDPLAPRCEATFAEGIDFRRPGYPNFVAEVAGMSGYETWGRWTEGDKAVFRFRQPLPREFTLLITADAFGPNIGQPITVKVGSNEQVFIIKEEGKTYRLPFKLEEVGSSVEIYVPKPASPLELRVPNNSDPRKLGVGLVSMKIEG